MLTYRLVDVFTTIRFGGNPLAVFPPQAGMPDEATMQRIANELNLSETTFVLPPADDTCDYRVRIFTPQVELPMAGHPTVGSAFVLGREGLVDVPGSVTFEQGVGPVPVTVAETDGHITATMQQPNPTFGGKFTDRAGVAALVSLGQEDLMDDHPVQLISAGVPFVFIPVRSLEAIRRAALRMDLWQAAYKETIPQLYLFTLETETPAGDVHSRMFGPGMGIPEDPATGAACGPLGAYLVKYGLAAPGPLLNEQGYAMGRPSQVTIRIEGTRDHISGVYVGGKSVFVGQGTLDLS